MAEHSIVGRIVKEKSLVGSIDKGTGMGELPSAAGQSEFPMPAYAATGTDLASVQASIAEKAGVEAPVFPNGWKEAVEGIEEPEELFFNPGGIIYKQHMELPDTIKTLSSGLYQNSNEMISFVANGITAAGHYFLQGCLKLKMVRFDSLTVGTVYGPRGCLALETASLGSIGKPVTRLEAIFFGGCTNSNLIITIYVDAVKFEDIPTAVSSCAPFGATYATIIYRNSTTGEVITE